MTTWSEVITKTNPYTASLQWRVMISTAAGYCKYIEEQDPQILQGYASFHGVKDIGQWARESISEIVDGLKLLKSQFDHDIDLVTSVLTAANRHIERLDLVGFQCWSVPNVDGLKTEGGHQWTLF